MISAENWCVKVDEKVYGPYTSVQLRKFAHEGRLAAWSQIAPAGSSAWRSASKEAAFASFFGADFEAEDQQGRQRRSFGKRDFNEIDTQKPATQAEVQTSNFVIIFDSLDGAALRLESAIRGLGNAFMISPNVWALTSNMTAVGVRNALAPHMNVREPLFVVDTRRGRTSWQNYTPELHSKISATFTVPKLKTKH